MFAQQVLRGAVHGRHVQGLPSRIHRTPGPGVEPATVADEVLVTPELRRESRIEAIGRDVGGQDPQIIGQHRVEPAHGRL